MSDMLYKLFPEKLPNYKGTIHSKKLKLQAGVENFEFFI